MDENIDVDYVGTPPWGWGSSDVGWYRYYNNIWQAADEGTLMQWSAAMNGSTAERAQGVCPTGWHLPSDAEWMYLENTLGMSVTDQCINSAWRNSGGVGSQLSTLTSGGSNSSGFTALFAGYRSSDGSFNGRGTYGYWWSSSETSDDYAYRRALYINESGVYRYSATKAVAFPVRCLKD